MIRTSTVMNLAQFLRSMLLEAKLAKKVNVIAHTDSTAGKSMATRFGTGKKTQHVELRFLYVMREWSSL